MKTAFFITLISVLLTACGQLPPNQIDWPEQNNSQSFINVETWAYDQDGYIIALPGAEVRLDNVNNEPRCVTPCRVFLEPGDYDLYLTKPGWQQGPSPLSFTLTDRQARIAADIPDTVAKIEANTLRHRLDRDPTGTWQFDGTRYILDWQTHVLPPSYHNPDSFIFNASNPALHGFWIEGELISTCENEHYACDYELIGYFFANGQRAFYRLCTHTEESCEFYSFTRLR